MRHGMMVFILVFTLVQALWCFYVGRRLVSPDLAPSLRGWIWAALIVLFLFQWLIPVDMWMDRRTPDYSQLRTLLYWASYLTMGFLTLLLFLVFFRDAAGWLSAGLSWFSKGGAPEMSRRFGEAGEAMFSPRGSLVLAAGALVLTLIGFVQALLPPRIAKIDIPVENLPRSFEGYRIAQISDLHLGPTHRRHCVERTARVVQDLHADLLVFTGDVADGLPSKLDRDVEPLAGLWARDGKLFVTGNHEYYWDARGWIERLGRAGFRTLMNEHVLIQKPDGALVVGGIPDHASKRIPVSPAPDIAKAFEGSPPGVPKILLAHQPKEGITAAALGVDLVVSGHTHGGQFIPFNLLTKMAQPLLGGLYTKGKTRIYVNRGTAYWGPPNRLGIPSEVTIINLKRKVEGSR